MNLAYWQKELAPFLAQLRAAGSDAQQLIDPASVLTAPWVAYKCQFGCPRYGKSPLCPPQTPDHQQTRALLDAYQVGILYRCRCGGEETRTGLAEPLVQALVSAGYYKAIAFDDTPRCVPGAAERSVPAFPTMEACGVDVLGSLRANSFPLASGRHPDGSWDCCGLILVE